MKFKKFGALLLSAVLCIGMAAPAFAYEGDTAPVEEPVLPEIVEEEDAVTITDEEAGALTPEGNLSLVDDYRGNLPTGKRSVPQPELLEQLYQKFNCAQPMDYHGHSLSVSDVILLNQAGKISAHYVDSIGFRELSGFQDKQERSSVLSQLKAKCDMPESNPTKCRKGRNDHAI